MRDMGLSEKITYSTVLIRCQYGDGAQGTGTGFIINLCHDKEKHTYVPVIITNSHVVKDSTKTTFEFCTSDSKGEPIDSESLQFVYNGNKWIHHPDESVDLQCLPLAPLLVEAKERNMHIFYIPLNADIIPDSEKLNDLEAIEDVIMIGYPIGLSDTHNHKPITRRGITATHPKNNYQGKKETLLDMACYPGSSGSPIFILNQGSYHSRNGIILGNRIYLLGILYGGPQFDAQGILNFSVLPNAPTPIVSIPMNLGVMIKAERILEFEKLFPQEENHE